MTTDGHEYMEAVIGWLLSQRANKENLMFLWCQLEQDIKQTADLQVNWDAIWASFTYMDWR